MDLSKYICIGCDIETVPAQDKEAIATLKARAGNKVVMPDLSKPQLLDALKDNPAPLGGLKVDELKHLYLQQFGGELALKAFEDVYKRTSFSALDGGEVISASAYIFGSGQEPQNLYRWREPGTEENLFEPTYHGPTEAELINKYFRYLEKVKAYAESNRKQILIVGAHIKGFDFKFLARRALHLGVDLPNFPLADTGYISKLYFDVIEAFGFYDRQDKVSLNTICKFLNIESPKADELGEIDGSMVWDIWSNHGKAGAERIALYNGRDCKVLEPVFNKIHHLVG